ncbi:hypothetical protein LXL04_002495 [Taraxacum kok-saghyz]
MFRKIVSTLVLHRLKIKRNILNKQPHLTTWLVLIQGWVVKQSLNNIVRKKYVLCNRSSKEKSNSCDTLLEGAKRRPNKNKISKGCKAHIIFEGVYGTMDYKVKKFVEYHNHPLESVEDRCHMKRARVMSYAEKEFIIRASTAKLGPTMAHKLRATLKGGYQYVGAKVTDYKNMRRGICRILFYKDA